MEEAQNELAAWKFTPDRYANGCSKQGMDRNGKLAIHL